ncbi:flagellar biosynthesis protein FliQ [[Clostridium] polysaccharolyticum]|jgi:flagellar biosynthetic protein FliQ|uniref:Flagellar biosynthetic protein FliQ n=1 Tax=[Clostridium] polysaccharolyticum TaxID=29364 RepID=A0A1H9Y2J5_9FIRM|nr:flagellar biosynthesis protein FliQ [[Clostridium] polysaccharolyticum]SES62997.1 flagellar biosynthetic protein FliQ [[Clostridium] polysaccharolyticum]
MTVDTVVDIARETLWVIVKVSAPMLGISLIVGLIISIFQTITSINEQTLTFLPKLLAIFTVLILAGSWILNSITSYTTELFTNFARYLG